MNNVQDLGLKVVLDKERRMKFSLNSLVDLQEEYGDVMKAFQDAVKKQDFKMVRKLLFVSLKDDDESLTESNVGSMVGMHNIADVLDLLTHALQGSVPDEDDEEEGKPKTDKKPPKK